MTINVRGRLVVRTVDDALNRETAEKVLAVMRQHGYVPDRIDSVEPVKAPFGERLFIEHWTGFSRLGGVSGSCWDADPIGKGSRHYAYFSWFGYCARHSRRTLSFILGTRPMSSAGALGRAEATFDSLSRFGQALCVAIGAVFGFVTPVIEERTSILTVKGDTNELSTFMPGLHWTTFVGAPWIDAVRQRTEGMPGLVREESGGILTLRLDASPLSQEVLSGDLAGRIQSSLEDQLFVPGSLPAVSYEKLWAKADSVLTSPPEARGLGTASWAEIAVPFQGMSLSETMESMARKGQGLGKTLGIKMDFTERSLDRLGKWLLDPGRMNLPVSRSEVVGSLGAYCGETMRRNLGGEWAVNPVFPDFPALRAGENWAYPLGQVEQCLNRLSGRGYTPAGFYRAYQEMGFLSGRSVTPKTDRDDSPPPEIDQSEIEEKAEGFVKLAGERWGAKLDYSRESLRALDLLADRVAETKGNERDALEVLMGLYVGETLRRVSGGRWAEHKDFGFGLWMSTAQSDEPAYVFPLAWVEKRVRNGMGDSLEFKARVILGWPGGEP